MQRSDFRILHGKAKKIGIQQDPNELFWLVNKVQQIYPQIIVEIGVYKGGTLKIWEHLVSPTGMVVGIDSQDIVGWDILQSPKDVRIIHGDSHKLEALETLKSVLNYDKIDFLFIDGDHSYNGVKADYYDYSPLVRTRGIIGFHDLLCCKNTVGLFFDELFGRKERSCLSEAYGTGILYNSVIF